MTIKPMDDFLEVLVLAFVFIFLTLVLSSCSFALVRIDPQADCDDCAKRCQKAEPTK